MMLCRNQPIIQGGEAKRPTKMGFETVLWTDGYEELREIAKQTPLVVEQKGY